MAETFHFTSYGSGIPLIFIHGWGLNSAVWLPTVEKFSSEFEVITVDLPGFGHNISHSVSPYTIDEVAEKIASVIDKPAIYIGWSLGGLIATQIAYQYPAKVTALVNVASSPYFVEKESWPGIKADVLSMFHKQLSEDSEKTINNFLKIQAMGSPHLRQDIKQLRELVMRLPIPSKATLDNSLKLLETVDQREIISKLSMPSLRIFGKLDGLVPAMVIEEISKLDSNSDLVIFEKASHAPFMSHPDKFYQSLTTWLQGLT